MASGRQVGQSTIEREVGQVLVRIEIDVRAGISEHGKVFRVEIGVLIERVISAVNDQLVGATATFEVLTAHTHQRDRRRAGDR